MAYALRYYKELTHPDGTVYRLEIHEKDGTAPAMEIGKVVQGLRLDVQGDTEIDAPIVKTSLTMTFVDAPDHADARTKKCGNWEEFYTSDATKWKVVMKYRRSGGASFVTMWGGYITPDSYTETLVYRGSVTIIARDNIGHMQDFPFDAVGNADGLISLKQLISGAWAKIESPMSLVLRDSGDAMWMYTDGVAAYDTMMNVSAFKDKNWLEALEDALYSYGVVMRYVGDNNVSIMPLRSLPLMSEASFDDVPTAEPVFMTGAERELTPAVRRIEEIVDYDIQEAFPQPLIDNYKDFTGEVDDYSTTEDTLYYWHIQNTTKGAGWIDSDRSAYFNPLAYVHDLTTMDDRDLAFMWMATTHYYGTGNVAETSRCVEYSKYLEAGALKVEARVGKAHFLDFSNPRKLKNSDMAPTTAWCSFAVTKTGITNYLTKDGEWSVTETLIECPINEDGVFFLEAPMGDFRTDALVSFRIHHIVEGSLVLAYYPIYSLTFNSQKVLLTKNSIITNYIEDNNVILSREPKIGPALDTTIAPSVIKNGIFYLNGEKVMPAKAWAWPDGSTSQQMAVYNHLQLLCYHAKPNSVIRGTIVNADLWRMSVIYSWQGLEMMLVSGSLNFISGHLENAVLREFARYNDMWGSLSEADFPEVGGESSTNVEGGSAGTSSASVENTTIVNIGGGSGGTITLDTYMSDSSENGVQNKVIKAYVDGEVKSVADLLTSMWRIEDNKIVTDMDVLIKANLIVEGDTSSGGEGQDTPASGIRGIYVNGTPYTDTDGDGFIDLGTISGGVSEITASMITSALGYTPANGEDYLPLAGGRITGNSLDIGREDNYAGAFVKIITNASTSADNGTSIRHYEKSSGTYTYKGLLIDKNGAYYSNNGSNYHLIHSGNIGSQSVNYATSAGNAATATKLATARTIWGQSFDGTGDVSGDLKLGYATIRGASSESAIEVNANSFNIGYGYRTTGKTTTVYGDTIRMAKNGAYTMSINSSGNVGIGTTSPAYKLDVAGTGRFTGAVTMSSTLSVTTSVTTPLLQSTGGLDIVANGGGTASRLWLTTNCFRPWSADAGLIDLGLSSIQWRNVYAVNGIFSGDTSSGSDIRFKDVIKDKTLKIEDIAKAPLFTFKWNDRDDDTIHLGSSAQYWENICPWLVTGEDFKSLNYATLGVAMGISLAKKAVNHEERIKELEKEVKRLKEE